MDAEFVAQAVAWAEQLGYAQLAVMLAAPLMAYVVWSILFATPATVAAGSRGAARIGAENMLKKVKRSTLLLVGPCGAGKTQAWLRLTGKDEVAIGGTHTSMIPNEGVAIDGGFPVVDYPGHRRLRDGMTPYLAAAKVVAVVVDGTTATDEATGAQAVASLVAWLLQNKAVVGGSGPQVVIAVNKRDDWTSFTSKSVKHKVEAELTAYYMAQDAAVGKAAVAGGRKGAEGAKRSETGVYLAEGERFTFETSCNIPIRFLDVAAVADEAFNLKPLTETMQ